ncbi:FAD-dependent monooxygenase [Pseudonocardia halophobica]|uniref:Monooxygenase n=1 Tax=Pseudonocardia halophobica TaxID=29401 RepID=A0A9W6LCP9_9PSEU|nr:MULTISPECIES: FAD-dependent monooxygenase [Pseudonocardia]MCE0762049.1 FAD-dependent monooxygenase [Pseudonocardia kujensis]GLL14469.1 putative monooxygenase [Pseudonocardia halophobica]
MPDSRDAVIVGGGIGGVSAALALSHSADFETIRVLERSDEFGEIGAGLQLAPNAQHALEALGIGAAELDRYAFRPGRLVMLDALSGEVITALDLGAEYERRYGKPYIVMHRRDLLDLLVDAAKQRANVELCVGQTVSGVQDEGTRAVARTEQGVDHVADLVIGADGLRSTVREQVVGDPAPVPSGYVSYRGTLPFDHVAELAGGRDVLVWAGPGMHLVQYPIRRGELYNQVVCFRSDRFDTGHSDWGLPDEIDEHYAEACAPVRASVELISRDRHWKMVDRDPVENWVRGRLALLGDAAHPMFQYVAQGACQALEDAQVLGSVLGAQPDIDAALVEYQRLRVPRAGRVQRTARSFGELLHLEGMGATVRNRLLEARAHDDYSESDWLHGHR